MRAMSNRGFMNEESTFQNRLIRCLRETGRKLRGIDRIRSNVFIVYTSHGAFLLKGFSNKRKLEAQKLLTKKLKENGFSKTYEFIRDIPSFDYQDETYEWIEFLAGSNNKFTYNSSSNRKDALELLDKFHKTTRGFYKSLPVSIFDQLEKWKERMYEFEDNIPAVKKIVPTDYVEEWLKWGKSSLAGLSRYEREFYDEPYCIVHGDVAHHNFFRKKNGSLYLIDFDLISKGPPVIDYLQYCNRIMPHIQNSSQLFDLKQIKQYEDNPAFLYALTYPTDIFREWNRLIRNRDQDQSSLHAVWKLSVEQGKRRMKLYREISSLI